MLSRWIEADRQYRRRISDELARDKEALRQYWSDPKHLEEKLQLVSETIAHAKLLPEEQIQSLAIHSGTGSVVLKKEDGEYHYVEVNMRGSSEPLYIAPAATLPHEEISNLRTLDAFTLTSR